MSEQTQDLERLLSEKESLANELARLRGSLRLRAADIFAEAVASPRAMLAAPGRLIALFREIAATRNWRALVLALECGLPDDELRRLAPPAPALARQVSQLRKRARARALEAIDEVVPSDAPALGAATARIKELRRVSANGPAWPERAARPAAARERMALMALHSGEPDMVNGYTRRSHELLRALNSSGWRVAALLRQRPGARDDAALDGVAYMRLAPIETRQTGLISYGEAYARAVEARARSERPALIHAASNHVTGYAAALAAARLGLPFIYEVRGLWEVTRASVEPSYAASIGFSAQRRMEIEIAKRADRLLVNGEALGEFFREAGVPAARIINAPNGSEPDGFDEAARLAPALRARWGLDARPVVGFVGSLTPYEGLSSLLEALRLAPARGCQLLIVGDGPHRSALESQARRLGLDGRAHFVGRVSPEEARAAYALIDIAPFPRPRSPVADLTPPLKPLDAMAAGCAIITSEAPPLAALAQDGRGIIVRSSDAPRLAAAIGHLLQDEAERARRSSAALAWVKKERTWQAIARTIAKAYESVS